MFAFPSSPSVSVPSASSSCIPQPEPPHAKDTSAASIATTSSMTSFPSTDDEEFESVESQREPANGTTTTATTSTTTTASTPPTRTRRINNQDLRKRFTRLFDEGDAEDEAFLDSDEEEQVARELLAWVNENPDPYEGEADVTPRDPGSRDVLITNGTPSDNCAGNSQ